MQSCLNPKRQIYHLTNFFGEKILTFNNLYNSRYEDFSASFVEVSTSVNQLEDVLKDIDALEHSINSHIKAGLIEIGRDSSISRQLEELTQSVRLAKLTKMAFENVEEAAILMEKKQYLETYVCIFESAKKKKIFWSKLNLILFFQGCQT